MKAMVKHQPPASSQFLTFLLDEQEYGLELFKIQEIRGFVPVTPIPNVPAHVRGVMNLRGTVLPVVDLRMKFRLPPIEYNKFTVIVIAMVGEKMVGLLVDAVSDVLQVTQEAMRAAPDFGSAVDGAAFPVVTFSQNVADGTKNSVPVTARLKSSSRS